MQGSHFRLKYNLQITNGNIEVHYIDGNHITMLDSDKVVAAINGRQIKNVKTLQANYMPENSKLNSIKARS